MCVMGRGMEGKRLVGMEKKKGKKDSAGRKHIVAAFTRVQLSQ